MRTRCNEADCTFPKCTCWESKQVFSKWLPMETAPKGGGSEYTTDDEWVDPPKILLLFNDVISVGYWDWYYAEGGAGYEGGLAWIEPVSGQRLDLEYGEPIGWMPPPDRRH